jgi:phosphoribosylanthranilate isomerase
MSTTRQMDKSPLQTLAVKICGIKDPAMARHAVIAGADAVGLVFVANTPRCVSAKEAQAIIHALPHSFTPVIGLAMNPSAAEWQRLATLSQSLPLNAWQFHGTEPVAELARWHTPWIKAITLKTEAKKTQFAKDLADIADYAALPLCRGFLVDAGAGDGKTMDWQALKHWLSALASNHPFRTHPLTLAGGLHANNVAEAIACLKPWIRAVDVSSGVEESRGVKSAEKISEFIHVVKTTDYASPPPSRHLPVVEKRDNRL